MKSLTLGTVTLALALLSSTALAFHCPADMKKIDAALANGSDIDATQMKAVKELRTTGEELHNSGKHYASVAVLAEAMQILGMK